MDYKTIFYKLYNDTENCYESFILERNEILNYVSEKLYFSHYESLMYILKKAKENDEDCDIKHVLRKDTFNYLKDNLSEENLYKLLRVKPLELKEYFTLKIFNRRLRSRINDLFYFFKELEKYNLKDFNSVLFKKFKGFDDEDEELISYVSAWSGLEEESKKEILEKIK